MNINRFLEYYIEDNPGPIINHNQQVVGQHKGLHRYTTGQRRGIGVPSNTDNEAYVVTHLDFKRMHCMSHSIEKTLHSYMPPKQKLILSNLSTNP